ncbi:MAG: hypothetical protein JST91_29880 [Actinobacteria bacterium]|nr:hypothetical protein [Actinomycetota bacterium]
MPDFDKLGRSVATKAQNLSQRTAEASSDGDQTGNTAAEADRLQIRINQLRPEPAR